MIIDGLRNAICAKDIRLSAEIHLLLLMQNILKCGTYLILLLSLFSQIKLIISFLIFREKAL